jgi:hypothetical protein
MSIMAAPKKKPRGRPPSGGRDPTYGIRLPDEMVEAIDDWAKKKGVTRSEAIRSMIENELKAGNRSK